MPAIVRSEFALALNQVAAERGVTVETLVAMIEEALLVAFRKDASLRSETVDILQFVARIDPNTGEARVFAKNADGTLGKDVTPAGFGRIATQTAGQVLRQKVREAEKKAIVDEFTQKVGAIVNGMILRFDGPNVVVDIRASHGSVVTGAGAEAIMPPQEQVSTERYHLNQRLVFYIKEIRETPRGSEIIVSRADEGLVQGLFKREVPEVANGSVIIKLIAREAGGRTKMAVSSSQSGVDPVGACVGQKGVRVQAVIAELGGTEKVDVIQYSDDAVLLISQALAPAKDVDVEIDEPGHTTVAYVPDDQLSLAIGRDGQNVRLAAKVSGWKIDIKGKSLRGQ